MAWTQAVGAAGAEGTVSSSSRSPVGAARACGRREPGGLPGGGGGPGRLRVALETADRTHRQGAGDTVFSPEHISLSDG